MIRFLLLLTFCVVVSGSACCGVPVLAQDDPIANGFHDVPPAARLRMFWRVFGPAWNRQEIDYELGLLRDAGVGGVMTCFTYPVEVDDPARDIQNQTFLSPTFLETLRYAALQAQQDGLQFGVCGGTGWPYGGPSVGLRDAAQRLHSELLEPLSDRSGYRLPLLHEGERYLAVFVGDRNVTGLIRRDHVHIGVGEEPCRVFIVGPTYQKVKRPAVGGEGYVIDHLSRQATSHFLDAAVAPLLKSPSGTHIDTLFCDSLEVYGANWTYDLPAQFRRRRGYDLIAHLPELFDNASPEAANLRYDFWLTVAELAEQEFAQTVHEFCRQNGVSFALEAYGTPPMGFTAAQQCDTPWGEQYEWQGFSFSRFAASGAHLAGKNIVGAEAWTWAGIPNRLADSLADLKLCSDLHFLAGENELTGVDFPYSPRAEGAPGWLAYFGPMMNANNPQWPFFHYLVSYINRCQWLLRQGEPVADVALYVPTEDAFAHASTDQMLLDFQLRDRLSGGKPNEEFGLKRALQHRSETISAILQSGYNYDGIDCFAMNALASAESGLLKAGLGRYSIVVLPDLEGIDLHAMEKIAQMCRGGGVVISTGRLPSRVYGLQQEQATDQLHALVKEMFGPDAYAPHRAAGTVEAHEYGSGHALLAADDRDALRKALAQLPAISERLAPDMHTWSYTRDVHPGFDIMHVHRRVGDRDFYFVVNLSDQTAQFSADFRATGKMVTAWNPLSGEITPRPIMGGGGPASQQFTTVDLSLPPHGSTFLCFAPGTPNPPQSVRTKTTIMQQIRGPWHVFFDGPDAPPMHDVDMLTSWVEWPQGKFFSGRGIYECGFTLPAQLPRRCLLRFDRVHEVGEVHINAENVGAVWLAPYEIDITRHIHPGQNRLQVSVGNLPVNRFLGQPDPDLTPLQIAYGDRFPAPEEKRVMAAPAPSGLIGHVTLIMEFGP